MSAQTGQKSYAANTTTATTTTTTIRTTRPFVDFGYIRTLSGLLKIVEMVLDLIAFICCVSATDYYVSDVGWATFVSITSLLATLILFGLYLFHLIEVLHGVPWLLIECFYCGIWVLFYLIASGLMAARASIYTYGAAYGAAAFFGFTAMIVYGFDCYVKFNAWRKGEVAQGTPPTIAMRSGANYS